MPQDGRKVVWALPYHTQELPAVLGHPRGDFERNLRIWEVSGGRQPLGYPENPTRMPQERCEAFEGPQGPTQGPTALLGQ